MTDSAPTMDASDLTPSKRRRTAESPTPATAQQPYVLPLRGTSIARLAADVGAMAAATARHGKFMASELYGPLVAMEQSEGWARLDSKPPSGGDAVTWLCLDVEMCERRRDGERFPVSACVTRTRWEAAIDGVRASQETLFNDKINPGDDLHWWDDHQVRSRRPVVWWCLHFLGWTRVHLTRSWVVSFSILRPRAGPAHRLEGFRSWAI
jgi:hypothetical protein